MANLLSQAVSFLYQGDLTQKTKEELETLGYYIGFPCAHNHRIRSKETHACYECSYKITSNICGFDVNYLNAIYKHKYVTLWESVQIGNLSDCWEIKKSTKPIKKRICLPSYRSAYSKQKSENVTLQKAIYQCAWGDVGNLSVTRTCKNPNCLNPLHLVSAFNKSLAPQTISPFDVDFRPEKLMRFAKHEQKGTLQLLLKSQYKFSIANPKFIKEPEE
jgi:hypothetical protein